MAARSPSEQPGQQLAEDAGLKPRVSGWRARVLTSDRSGGMSAMWLIRWVSFAQILQGVLEAIAVIVGVFAVAAHPGTLSPIFLTFFALTALVAPARIAAGVMNRDWRGRWLSIVVAVTGVLTFSALCVPTSPVVLVLVIVVQTDRHVREAFSIREGGASAREVKRWLSRPVHPRRAR